MLEERLIGGDVVARRHGLGRKILNYLIDLARRENDNKALEEQEPPTV